MRKGHSRAKIDEELQEKISLRDRESRLCGLPVFWSAVVKPLGRRSRTAPQISGFERGAVPQACICQGNRLLPFPRRDPLLHSRPSLHINLHSRHAWRCRTLPTLPTVPIAGCLVVGTDPQLKPSIRSLAQAASRVGDLCVLIKPTPRPCSVVYVRIVSTGGHPLTATSPRPCNLNSTKTNNPLQQQLMRGSRLINNILEDCKVLGTSSVPHNFLAFRCWLPQEPPLRL